MKIAILGWGSLIWQPKELEFDKEFYWQKDGPTLPIEFARISNDGRLTLVITEEGTSVQTLYIQSIHKELEAAVLNLAIREGSRSKSIGSYNRIENKFSPESFEFKQNIIDWIANTNFDGVIWTNLSEKWEKKNEDGETTIIDSTKRIEYLKSLKGNQRELAIEYIHKTPEQIKTKYRAKIEEELN